MLTFLALWTKVDSIVPTLIHFILISSCLRYTFLLSPLWVWEHLSITWRRPIYRVRQRHKARWPNLHVLFYREICWNVLCIFKSIDHTCSYYMTRRYLALLKFSARAFLLVQVYNLHIVALPRWIIKGSRNGYDTIESVVVINVTTMSFCNSLLQSIDAWFWIDLSIK